MATVAALRYARSLRPTTLRAVRFVIDSAQAGMLRREWVRANTGVALDFIDAPDRRVARAAAELVSAEAELPGVGVTVILPRRGYSPLLGRLLHDRTADKIAAVVSRIPHAAATIVPFDVRSRLEAIQDRQAKAAGPVKPDKAFEPAQAAEPTHAAPEATGPATGEQDAAALVAADAAAADPDRADDGSQYERPLPPPGG